jgi:hypothetical protein
MKLNVAVFYTGEMRTINKCISYFKKNVLINDDVHVFATLQTHPYTETYNESVLKELLGNHLKSLMWFRNDKDEEYVTMRDNLIETGHIKIDDMIYYYPQSIKDYLKLSGTIAETYQYFMSYKKMVEYEIENNIKYDYIIRIRTDVVITKKIDFSFLTLTDDDVLKRLNRIKYKLLENDGISKKCILFFMNSLLDEERMFRAELNDNCTFLNNAELDGIRNLTDLNNYIKNGKYIITIRKNLFFLIKRDLFDPIHDLAFKHGKFIDDNDNTFHTYFWNGESQFQRCLTFYQITQFNSTCLIEDESLYMYEKNKYFLDDGSLNTDLNIFLFLCRV